MPTVRNKSKPKPKKDTRKPNPESKVFKKLNKMLERKG